MKARPLFLTTADVLETHEALGDAFGQPSALKDLNELELALSLPTQTFHGELIHADLFEIAVAYAFHLARAQAFAAGNERTAVAAALTFLEMNDVRVRNARQRLVSSVTLVAMYRRGEPLQA